MKHANLAWMGVVCLFLVVGCGPMGPTGADEEGELYNSANLLGQSLFDIEGLAPPALAIQPFIRVGLMWDAEPDTVMEGRVLGEDGRWGEWLPIEAYWEEGLAHAGHLDVQSGSGEGFQLRLSDGSVPLHVMAEGIERLGEYAFEEPVEDLAQAELQDEPYGALEQALAPSSLVHPRSDWGARSPRCSSGSHSPNRVTVHHTATPLPDSVSVKTRLRQIQSYHMYTQGWCDIGYHLLVDWNGAAWQGRNEKVIGAHVANQNTGNVGLSYLGTYSSRNPTAAQITKGAKILRWLHNSYGIALNRDKIKGHRQRASTSCPGDRLYAKLNAMVAEAKSGTSSSSSSSGTSSGSTTTTKGTMTGVVFRDKGRGTADMSTRLPGARVTISGVGTKTAAAGDAAWSFKLAPKTYTVTASASGYKSASRSCKVESGKTTWCSIGLVRVVQPGTLKGVVFEDRGVGTADMSRRLPGATVTISGNGSLKASGSDAYFSKALPAGSYTVTASASGYARASRTCSVQSGKDSWCSVGLVPTGSGGASEGEPDSGDSGGGDVSGADSGGGDSSGGGVPADTFEALPGLLTGFVIGPFTGDTIVTTNSGQESLLNSSGRYEFLDLPPGVYEVSCQIDGFGFGSSRCQVFADQPTVCDIVVDPTAEGIEDGDTAESDDIIVGCATAGPSGSALLGLLALALVQLRRRR